MARCDRPGREHQGRRVDAPEHRHGRVDGGTNRGRDPDSPLTLAEFRVRGEDQPVGGRKNQTRNRLDRCSVCRRRIDVEVVRERPCSDNRCKDRGGQDHTQAPASATRVSHVARVGVSPQPPQEDHREEGGWNEPALVLSGAFDFREEAWRPPSTERSNPQGSPEDGCYTRIAAARMRAVGGPRTDQLGLSHRCRHSSPGSKTYFERRSILRVRGARDTSTPYSGVVAVLPPSEHVLRAARQPEHVEVIEVPPREPGVDRHREFE